MQCRLRMQTLHPDQLRAFHNFRFFFAAALPSKSCVQQLWVCIIGPSRWPSERILSGHSLNITSRQSSESMLRSERSMRLFHIRSVHVYLSIFKNYGQRSMTQEQSPQSLQSRLPLSESVQVIFIFDRGGCDQSNHRSRCISSITSSFISFRQEERTSNRDIPELFLTMSSSAAVSQVRLLQDSSSRLS